MGCLPGCGRPRVNGQRPHGGLIDLEMDVRINLLATVPGDHRL